MSKVLTKQNNRNMTFGWLSQKEKIVDIVGC